MRGSRCTGEGSRWPIPRSRRSGPCWPRPRPAGASERRQRLDALGMQYQVAEDVRVEPVQANGITAEWTSTPDADPARVILFSHGGGYMAGLLNSHRHVVAQVGREARARTLARDYRLAPELDFRPPWKTRLPVIGFCSRRAMSRSTLPGRVPGRAGGCHSGFGARREAAAASLHPVEFAMGRSGGDWPEHDREGAGPSDDPEVQVGSTETLLDDAVRLAGVADAANMRVRLEI